MNNEELKIQMRLGNKMYPIVCKREEEAIYRKAIISFNEKLKAYKKQFEGLDKIDEIDILSLTGFHFALQLLRQSNEISNP